MYARTVIREFGRASNWLGAGGISKSCIQAHVTQHEVFRFVQILKVRRLASREIFLVVRRFHKERGALRPRMAADPVATPLDPLRDINGLKRIDFVMKNGLVYRRP